MRTNLTYTCYPFGNASSLRCLKPFKRYAYIWKVSASACYVIDGLTSSPLPSCVAHCIESFSKILAMVAVTFTSKYREPL